MTQQDHLPYYYHHTMRTMYHWSIDLVSTIIISIIVVVVFVSIYIIMNIITTSVISSST